MVLISRKLRITTRTETEVMRTMIEAMIIITAIITSVINDRKAIKEQKINIPLMFQHVISSSVFLH